MAAWLDRTPTSNYSGPLSGKEVPGAAPNINDLTTAHILFDGDNIIGPCIVDWIHFMWDNQTTVFTLIDGVTGDISDVKFPTDNTMSGLDSLFVRFGAGMKLEKGLFIVHDGNTDQATVGYR